jgi:hypothetical protein
MKPSSACRMYAVAAGQHRAATLYQPLCYDMYDVCSNQGERELFTVANAGNATAACASMLLSQNNVPPPNIWCYEVVNGRMGLYSVCAGKSRPPSPGSTQSSTQCKKHP